MHLPGERCVLQPALAFSGGVSGKGLPAERFSEVFVRSLNDLFEGQCSLVGLGSKHADDSMPCPITALTYIIESDASLSTYG